MLLPHSLLPHNPQKPSLFLHAGLLIYFCYGVWHSVQKKREGNSHTVHIKSVDAQLEKENKGGSFTPLSQTKL